jgi:PAS domain S-box-containing protein
MNKSLSLQDFIDLDELQAIQDSFAETTGISSVILSPEGEPLTRLTNPTDFCSLIQSTEEGKQCCRRSFVEMSKKALKFKEPQIFYCFAHGGHFVAPIIINGEHKATMFAGQFILESFSTSQLDELKKIAVEINVDPVQLIETAKQMRVIDKDVIQNNANFMFQIVKVTTRLGMQAEEALLQSEIKYRTLVEHIPAITYIASLDESSTTLYVSPQIETMLGISPADYKADPDFWMKHIHPDDLERVMDEIRICHENNQPFISEYRMFSKDGRLVWFSDNALIVKDENGKPLHLLGVMYDITEHKQAKEALRRVHENTKTILEKAPFGVVVVGKDRKIKRVNDTALKMAGVENADIMLGKDCSEYLCPEQRNECTILDRGQQVDNSERNFRRKDGKEIPIIKTVTEINMDGEDVLLETFIDITDRKRAEEMLKNKQKMESAYTDMLTIINKTLDLHIIITEGLDSLMKYTDAQAGAVYLYDPDSTMMIPNTITGMEKTVVEQTFSPGEGIVGEAAQKQEMVVVTSVPADTIYTITSGSNKIVPATIISTPMIFKGTLLGVVVTCHNTNISLDVLIFMKRIIDQYAVALNNANTLIQVQDMAASLKNQRDELEIKSYELEEASRTKSEFLTNMSHELRTPLNSIIGFSEVLYDGTFGPLNEKQTKYINNVLISGKHLLELINGILDLAKVEAGKMELICQDFNVSEVFDESMMLLSSIASKKNIVLSAAVDKEFTMVHADVGKFKQILYNLMSNAIKFTPMGGSVTVEAHRSGDIAYIAVSDTGIGISKEQQDILFKPFMQVDASASRQYQGTGLGLSLVKRFVEMHGGRVWVESELDRGSTFTFTIPIKKDQHITSHIKSRLEKKEDS